MNKERYSFKTEGNDIYAGGVILYKTNDEGDVDLLLIKNRERWEDLGGTIDKQDKDIYTTVAREASE